MSTKIKVGKPYRTDHRINVDQVKLANQRFLDQYAKFRGRHVELLEGKYKGRIAVIDSILMDNHHGLLFCCYVLRHDLTGVLNSDAESRTYRPVQHFRLLDPSYYPGK